MVTKIDIVDVNQVDNCRLYAVHNRLLFYFDANYTGTPPDYLIVELTVDGISYITGKAIFFKDLGGGKRRFLFDASEFVKALIIDSIDDFEQADNSVIQTDVSRVITVVVKSDIQGTLTESFQFEALNATRNDYEGAAVLDLYSNSEEVYFAIEGEPVYIYYYGAGMQQTTSYALDYNDDIFTDYADNKFVID